VRIHLFDDMVANQSSTVNFQRPKTRGEHRGSADAGAARPL